MAESLAPIWEFIRQHGLTLPEEHVTITFEGHEGVVEVPDDLVAENDGDD